MTELIDAYDAYVSREIETTRILNAPRELVSSCVSKPEHLVQWWGPRGFRNTFHTCNPVPGGDWTFTMHGPDGTDYPNQCRFLTIDPANRIVIEHLGGMHHFLVTLIFEPYGTQNAFAQTKVTFRQLFDTAEARDAVATFASPGNEQNMDRLAELLQSLRS